MCLYSRALSPQTSFTAYRLRLTLAGRVCEYCMQDGELCYDVLVCRYNTQ